MYISDIIKSKLLNWIDGINLHLKSKVYSHLL